MKTTRAFLLAGTALTIAGMPMLPATAANSEQTFIVAQAGRPDEKKPEPQAQPPAAQQPRPGPRPAPPPAAQQPRPPQPPAAQPPAPRPQPPAAQPPAPRPQPAPPPAAQQPRPPQPAQPAAPRPPQAAPPSPPAQPQQQRPGGIFQQRNAPNQEQTRPTPPAEREQRREPPQQATPPRPPAPAPRPGDGPRGDGRRDGRDGPRDGQRDGQRDGRPGDRRDQQQAAPPSPPGQPPAPPRPGQPPAPGGGIFRSAIPPSVAPKPPEKPRDAREFFRRDNNQPQRGLDDVRRERRETREGDRIFIREGDRTIVREGDRAIIRHSESDRFAVGARDVRVNRRGNETFTVIARPNGISITTVTDANGRLIRRSRRGSDGREVIIIDNRDRGPRRPVFVDLPPPRITIPREHYIVNAYQADPRELYEVFIAPPVQPLDEVYSLEQVRYSAPLRDRMPRVDLDVNFETGSWQLSPEQVDELADIAEGLKRAIARNPREVFLIEGHTDLVGSQEDNLSLSDRRAESVAVALTEQFGVPPENLVTQGYGEDYPKVDTDGPSRENRRVAIRRITPLMAEQR